MSKLSVMRDRNMEQVSAYSRIMKILSQILVYAFLLTMAFIVIFPFYWMIISSLKEMEEYRRSIPTWEVFLKKCAVIIL